MTNSNSVSVTRLDDAVALVSPYSDKLPTQAKALGGRWNANSKAWIFDIRDEDRVRELARSIYGTDGSEDPDDTVTIRIRTAGWSTYQSIDIAGRTVAERRGRDADVSLTPGAIVVEGAFDSSGGSRNNPTIGRGDAILEVRDFPRAAAEMAAAKDSDITIIDAPSPEDALRSERERLVARIAEIDALLGEA